MTSSGDNAELAGSVGVNVNPPHFSSQGPIRADHSVGRPKVFHNTFFPPTRSSKPGRPNYSSETYPGTGAYDVAFGSTVSKPKKKPNIVFRRASTEKKSMVSPSASTPKLGGGMRSSTPKAPNVPPSPSSRLSGAPTPKRSSTTGSPSASASKSNRSTPYSGHPAGTGPRVSRPTTPQRMTVGDKVNITVQQNIINFEVDLNQAKGPEIAASMFEALGIGMPTRSASDGATLYNQEPAPPPVVASRSPSSVNDRKNRWVEPEDGSGGSATAEPPRDHSPSPAPPQPVAASAPAAVPAAAAGAGGGGAGFGGGRFLALDMLNAAQLEYLAKLGYSQADFTDDPFGKNSTIKRRPGRSAMASRSPAHVDDAPEISVDYEIQQIQRSHSGSKKNGRPTDATRERNVMAPVPNSQSRARANSRDDSPDDSPALRQFSNTIPPLDLRFANIASPRSQMRPADAKLSHRSDIHSPDPNKFNGLHISRGSAFSNRSSQASSRSTTSVNSTASHRQRPSTDDGGTSDTSSSRDQSDL